MVKEHEARGEKSPPETAEGLWGVSTWRKTGDGEPGGTATSPLLTWVQVLRSQSQLQLAWCLLHLSTTASSKGLSTYLETMAALS